MELHLENAAVVVVGGASGIGKACVDAFLAEGSRVAIWDQDPTTPQLAAERSMCHGVVVDIVDKAAVAEALIQTEKALGPVDHVVHAAAVGSGCFGFPFTQLQPSDWDRVLNVNIKGMVHVAHAFTPAMVDRNQGSFVFIASVAGQIGSPTDPPYTASKAANISFAQVMARDLASNHIRVNTICPGMVKTPLNKSVWRSWNDRQTEAEKLDYDSWADQKIRQLVPLGTWQSPSDIAHMAIFLASDCASQVTGQTINVDGGYVMHW